MIGMRSRCFAIVAVAALAGCTSAPQAPDPRLPSGDNSRNSLDWQGTYVGTVPCADCPGIRMRIELKDDGTFARSFVAQTGTTPLAWLTSQRVGHAQSLLEESTLDLEEVARRCGFGSAALLRHHFRRAVGITPTEYRQTFRFAA